MQHSNMKEHEREAFLEEFEKERQGTLVAFCVMGGIFGEGIDLKNDRLIGAIIVGTGLPQVSDEREILKNYYDERGLSGFDYAFRYPGMNKVLQAAGRVIRTSEDRGVILLLDERFLQREYGALFPREWEKRRVCRSCGKKLAGSGQTSGRSFKNSSVEAETGRVGFNEATSCRCGIVSCVRTRKRSSGLCFRQKSGIKAIPRPMRAMCGLTS